MSKGTVMWRAVSTLVESSYGSAQTVDRSLYNEGGPMVQASQLAELNEAEKTGLHGPSDYTIKRWITNGMHSRRLKAADYAVWATILMGDDSTTNPGAGVYKHVLTERTSTKDLRSRTVIDYTEAQQSKYLGVICTDLSLTSERDAFMRFEATLAGDGSKTADVASQPSTVAGSSEGFFSPRDCTIIAMGTYNATDITGGTDVSSSVVGFTIAAHNQGAVKYQYAAGDNFASAAERGERYAYEVSLDVEQSDSTETDWLYNGTSGAFEFTIVGDQIGTSGYYFTIKWMFPSMRVTAVAPEARDGRMVVPVTLTPLWTSTYDIGAKLEITDNVSSWIS